MKKEVQASLMHHQRLGERERFTDKTSQALSERLIPALHMSCIACFLSDCGMLLFRDHGLIRCPEIGEAVTSTVGRWDGLPQLTTGSLASVSDHRGDHLTRLATQGDPDPRLIGLFRNKGPELISFQDRRSWIGRIRCYQGLTQGRKLRSFFLIQTTTVWRETPNVRSRPR